MKKSGAKVSTALDEHAARGSVLMEFLVVAPVYLVLLGGMFILGDLMLNRIRMHIGDRYVTWVGGSRYCPVTEDADGKKRADDKWVGESLRPLFARSIGGEAAVDFKADRKDDDGVQINDFMALYMGGVTNMTVSLPGWATGMMSAVSIFEGDGSTVAADDYSKPQYDVNYFRTFVFLRGFAPERLNKDVDAGEMISRRLANAVNDTWINEKDDSGGTQMPEDNSGAARNVLRMLGRFAE